MNDPPLNGFPFFSDFAPDYQSARQQFLNAAQTSHVHPQSYPHPLLGPQGEALATDVVWLGEKDAGCVLVIISATHGVEGFHGSAAQCDVLRQPPTLPEGVALLLIHAINPYGFAWLRRVNEDGVDLNRNFVDFTQPLPHNLGYDDLADAIVPESLDAQMLQDCDALLEIYRQIHGDAAYEKALSSGQFAYPSGLFYGGVAPSWSRQIAEEIIETYALKSKKRVALLDFHTGLGPFAYGEIICDHPPSSQATKLAKQWFGDAVTEPELGTSTSVAKYGLSDYGWMEKVGEQLVFVTLEFGTYSFENMMQVLRADHVLHAKGDIDWFTDKTKHIKADIRRHFYPDTDDWREKVLVQSRDRISQAIEGLAVEVR